MQSYQLAPSKVNSKACDQCYRCKVKCTMEQNGCARCRMTSSVCTYSLGKWMGRPKKFSKAGAPSKNSRAMKSAVSVSLEGSGHHPKHIVDLPEENKHWELLLSGMESFSPSTSDPTTLSPFAMDVLSHYKTDGYSISVDNDPASTSLTSPIRIPNRDTLRRGVEILNSAPSLDFEQVNNHGHQDGSHSQPPHTPNRQQDFSFGSIGKYTTASPLASPVDVFDICPMDYAKRSDKGQTSPIPQKTPSSREGEPCHCYCSQAALACLDKISTVPSEARYVQYVEAIQFAFLTAEKLVLCTNCTPNMIIAKCYFVLEDAHKLTVDMSSQLEEATNDMGTMRQVKEDIRRVKRRATMLFAGLGMLQDLESRDQQGLSNMQSEFLLRLAKSWSSLSEPGDSEQKNENL